MYTIPFVNAVGCPSTWKLNLTIQQLDTTLMQSGVQLISNQTAAAYQWLDCNNGNSPISLQTSQLFTALSNGNYSVIISKNGCVDTSSCYPIISVGWFEEALDYGFQLLPNPTETNTMLYSKTPFKKLKLRLIDLSGQELIQKTGLSGNEVKLELSALSQGIYFLELQEGSTVNRLKLLKL